MRIAQADTAVDCFHDHVVGIARGQYQTILDAMRPGRDYSLTELAELTGMRNSTLAGRCNEMRSSGLIELAPKRKCSVTRITITPCRLPVRGQMGLF